MLAFFIGLPVSGASVQTTNLPAITGIWESERCDVQERNGTRTSSRSVFVFLESEWALEFTQVLGRRVHDAFAAGLLPGSVSNHSTLESGAGAHEATFGFSSKRLTLYGDGPLAQANGGACGARAWTRGREEDVSSTGCLWVVPVSACREEFDLVKVDGDRLLLGERPAPVRTCAAKIVAHARSGRFRLVRRVRTTDAEGRD